MGFAVLDLLASETRSLGEGGWEKKYDSQFLKLKDVILAKPQTFMNLSGKAVKEMVKFFPDFHLVVVHDELDFPLGTIKIMKNISSAGHNGVQSVIDELGTQDFVRIRLGVNNPETKGQTPPDDYVLGKFAKAEKSLANEMLIKARQALEIIQTEGLEAAQSKFNG